MAKPTVSQARSFKENPRHFPRKLQVGIYNTFSKRLPYRPLPVNPQKILVQAQEKIGDAVLLLPTIGGLKKLFPDSVIHILCSSANEPIFQSLIEIEKTMVYRTGRRFWQSLRETDYDLFYNPKDHPSITAFKIAKHVQADVKVCLAHRRQEQHYHHGLTTVNTCRILEKNGTLLWAYDFGFQVEPFFPNVDFSGPKNDNEITINFSAGSESRKWPSNQWIDLISLLIERKAGIKINILAHGSDVDQARRIEAQFKTVVDLYDQLNSILEAGPIIQRSALLVSPDTAMIHVADAVGTPVAGLYSGDKRNVERYRPFWVKHQILQSESLSIQNIDPINVFNASIDLMNQKND